MIVKSGEPVTITGYYKLVNHNPECFRTTMSNGMFFKKREEAPMTGACEHVAEWELISEYESKKLCESCGKKLGSVIHSPLCIWYYLKKGWNKSKHDDKTEDFIDGVCDGIILESENDKRKYEGMK